MLEHDDEEPEVPVVTRQAQYAAKTKNMDVNEEDDDQEVFGEATPNMPTQPCEQNVKQQHANSKRASEPKQHPTIRALGHLLALDETPPRAEPAEPNNPGGLEEAKQTPTFEEAAKQKMERARAYEASSIQFQQCLLLVEVIQLKGPCVSGVCVC